MYRTSAAASARHFAAHLVPALIGFLRPNPKALRCRWRGVISLRRLRGVAREGTRAEPASLALG